MDAGATQVGNFSKQVWVLSGERHHSGRDAGSAVPNSPVLTRYADDFAVLCTSREQAEQVKARLAQWLAPQGFGFQREQDTHRSR